MYIFPVELEILRIMQPVDRDIFFYLAARMDYETGLIGKERKITYGRIAFDLTEHDGERRVKSTLQILNGRQVRNSIDRLIKSELLENLNKRGPNKGLFLARSLYVDFLSDSPKYNFLEDTVFMEEIKKLKSLLDLYQ